jgi:amino acid transporter/nucleotide-binding universal stress UspA family protein
MTDERAHNSTGVEVSLSRDLGLAEVLMIGLGPNIGSSIFLLIGFAAGIAGPALLVAFVLNFIVTLFTAMAYAELASAYPETGGGYLWVKEGLFAPLGFLGGWMSWIGHCIACSVYAIGFGEGIRQLVVQYHLDILNLDPQLIATISTVLIAIAFCYLNYRGVKGAGRSEIMISLFLIGTIVLFCLFCVVSLFTDPTVAGSGGYVPFLPFGYISIAVCMGFTFMIFEGYEVVAQTGEEAKNPERTVPRAMFMCITISAVLFIAVAALTFAVIGWQAAADAGPEALTVTAQRVVPFLGGALMSVGVIVGSVAAVNSIVFSASRVSFAMGRDGNLPAVFGRLHPKNHTPAAAIIISGIIIIFMAVTLPINSVAAVADVLILLLFVLVNIAAISLRRKHPEVKRHFMTPFFPWIPIVGVVSKFFLAVMLFNYESLAWYIALAVIFAGLLVHYFAKGRREIERFMAPAPAALSEEAKARYRVLIPIDDPRNEALIDLGVALAAKNDGEILLTNVVEVPSAVPLDAVDKKRVEERKRTLERLKSYSEMRGIRTRAIVLVSHEVVTSIIDTAKDQAVNVIIVGWKGYTNTQKRVLGRKLDDIVRKTPCDIMVLKAEGKLKPHRIMILSGGLWHVSKATEVAADIAQMYESRVTILNVIVNERYLVRAADYSKRLKKIVESRKVPVIIKETRPESFISGVVAESLETDLLVIGSSAAKKWDQFAFGAIQDVIAKNAKCPVLVYKRVGPGTPDAPDETDE